MTVHTHPVPSESAATAEDSSRRVGPIVLLLLVITATAAGLGYRAASHTDHPPRHSSEQLQAVAALTLPSRFDRVDTTWGCVSDDQSACFTSSLTGLDAVETLARAMGVKTYRTYSTQPGNSDFATRYSFCTTVASAPASVLVSALPTNAVEQASGWIVPAGQEPKFDGSVVNVHLTGTGTCP